MNYFIPSDLLPALENKITRINKKASKLGQVVSMTRTGVKRETVQDLGGALAHQYGPKYYYTAEEVVVEGVTPVVNGWEFMGIIRHRPAGNELNCLPADASWITADERWHSYYAFSAKNCQHCNENRVRNATYLLYNRQSDTFKQVGSSCLADFTGHHDPQAAASACESIYKLLIDFQNASGTASGRTTLKFNVTEWLAFTAMNIRKHGWVSGSRAWEDGDLSTKNRTKMDILGYYSGQDIEAPSAADFDRATINLTWATTEAREQMDASDFATQFLASFSTEVDETSMGLTAAVFACKDRAEREAAKKLSQATQGYIGTVGEKITVDATLESQKTFMGSYGMTTIFTFKSETNLLTWFSTGSVELETGKSYKVAGRVKAHQVNRYTGNCETLLTRCKVM